MFANHYKLKNVDHEMVAKFANTCLEQTQTVILTNQLKLWTAKSNKFLKKLNLIMVAHKTNVLIHANCFLYA